jgi:hypothetical protein
MRLATDTAAFLNATIIKAVFQNHSESHSMFFFKPKKLYLDVLTDNPLAYQHFKPTKAANFYPHWWKSLDKKYLVNDGLFHATTMKSCPGFIDVFSRGLMMPLWSDLAIEVGAVGSTSFRWQFSDQVSDISVHPQVQRGSFLPEQEFQHLKLTSPWSYFTKDDVDFASVFPIWNQHRPDLMFGPHAVLNFKHQNSTHVNLFLRRLSENQVFTVEAGHPIQHHIPLTDRELVIKHHLVDSVELRRRTFSPMFKFTNGYKAAKRAANSKCPIHSGA